jgi:predicted ATPase
VRLTYFGGPAWDAGALPARGRGQESLLFRLAVDAGAAVSVRALSDDLWPVDAPDDPRAAVQSLVSRLRRALGSEAIEAVSGGYRLTLGRDEIDLTRFQDLVAAARRADDPARAAALARDALGLWTADPWVPDDFDWARRDLLEDRAHAERLAGGDHAPVGAGAVGGERIPAALTPLIGRADEIALAEAQLTDERLLTLIGPGGAGKTTLALEIARRHSPAVFVELAPADAGGVWDAVATALGRGVRLSDGTVGQAQGSRERALAALAGRPLLLVLDNAEHVVADAAQVAAEALRVAPALRLLVTSREPLGVAGEAFVNVGSLPEADAVTLLSARIRAARGYAPDAGERAAVARIARRLDGLPLALELAGAKARVLSIAEIEDGLADRFALLDRGPRTAEPRHQALRAVIDWSWSLLDEPERDALLALAVFPDGISAGDLREVTAAFGLRETAIDDLVDRSLVQRSRGRYRLLETVREYGLDALHRSGRLEIARELQATVMAQLALAQDRALRTATARPAIAWFDANEENLAAATRFCAGRGELEVRLARAQLWIWQLRERFDVLTSVLNATAAPADALASEADVVVAAMAMLMRTMLDPTTAHLSAQSVARIADAARDHDSELAAILPVVLRGALRARQERRGDEPWSTYLRLDESELSDGPAWSRAFAAVMNAATAQNNGDIDTLGEASGRALDAFRRLGDAWGTALASQMQSEWLMLQGRLEESLRIADESTQALVGLTSVSDLLQQQALSVSLLLRLGRDTEARERVDEMLARAQADGSERAVAQAAATAAALELVRGDGAAALRELERAGSLEQQQALAGFPAQVAAWQESKRALALLLTGDAAAAADALRRAAPVAVRTGDQPIMSDVAVAFARWFLAADRLPDAAAALAEADRLRGRADLSDPIALPVRDAVSSAGPDAAASGPAELTALVERLDGRQAFRM